MRQMERSWGQAAHGDEGGCVPQAAAADSHEAPQVPHRPGHRGHAPQMPDAGGGPGWPHQGDWQLSGGSGLIAPCFLDVHVILPPELACQVQPSTGEGGHETLLPMLLSRRLHCAESRPTGKIGHDSPWSQKVWKFPVTVSARSVPVGFSNGQRRSAKGTLMNRIRVFEVLIYWLPVGKKTTGTVRALYGHWEFPHFSAPRAGMPYFALWAALCTVEAATQKHGQQYFMPPFPCAPLDLRGELGWQDYMHILVA